MASHTPNISRRSSRAGSRQAGSSGGVVGLPSAMDDFFTSSQMNDSNFLDEFLNSEVYDGIDPALLAATDNGFQYGSNPNFGSGLGISIPDPQVTPQLENHYLQGTASYDLPNQEVYPSGNQCDQLPEVDQWDTRQVNYPTGLAALPGTQDTYPELPLGLPCGPDPYSAVTSFGPYFRYPITRHQSDLPAVDPPAVPQPEQPPASVVQEDTTIQPLNKQKPVERDSDSESEEEATKTAECDSDAESEDEAPVPMRPYGQGRREESQRSRRDSNLSETNSLTKPARLSVIRAGELPKKVEDKSWIRINATTKGETTRTARINQFTDGGSNYKANPLPVGNWSTERYKFGYQNNHGMHQFAQSPWSVRKIVEYIGQHPGQLRLWIQVTPGDSARRYGSKSHSECIFKSCPNRQWANKGTIEVGNYRVAFDEKHTYGHGVVDPFDCAGYAHLYCMERFLNFASLCKNFDVRVDTRHDMKKEPKGEPAFVFSKKHIPERLLAEKFIRAAKSDQLHLTPEFWNYPNHAEYKGAAKPHEQTLTHAMYTANWEHRPVSQIKQFLYRPITPASCGVHRGDQEIIMADKQIESMKVYKKAKAAKRHKNFNYSLYYDGINPAINLNIAALQRQRAGFERRDAEGISRRRKPAKQAKRPAAVFEDSDDEDETNVRAYTREAQPNKRRRLADDLDTDDEEAFFNVDDDDDDGEPVHIMPEDPTRIHAHSSLRKKARINYAEPEDVVPEPQFRRVEYPQQGNHAGSRRPSGLSGLFEGVGTRYEMPEDIDLRLFQTLTQAQIDAQLERRKSSAIGPRGSIMKKLKAKQDVDSPQTARTASFDAQPVSSSKEYNVNDPPRQVAGRGGRRRSSARLARK